MGIQGAPLLALPSSAVGNEYKAVPRPLKVARAEGRRAASQGPPASAFRRFGCIFSVVHMLRCCRRWRGLALPPTASPRQGASPAPEQRLRRAQRLAQVACWPARRLRAPASWSGVSVRKARPAFLPGSVCLEHPALSARGMEVAAAVGGAGSPPTPTPPRMLHEASAGPTPSPARPAANEVSPGAGVSSALRRACSLGGCDLDANVLSKVRRTMRVRESCAQGCAHDVRQRGTNKVPKFARFRLARHSVWQACFFVLSRKVTLLRSA